MHERAFFAAVDFGTLSARDNLRAFGLADFDVIQNLFELTVVNLRTHLSFRLPRQTDFDGLEFGFDGGKEFVVNGILHENSRTRTADLTLIEQNAHARAVNRLVEVAIVEVNVRGLAAEFQRRGN